MSTVLFDPIKAQSKITDSVIVAFSCGKESVVTLDLCSRYFKNIKAFFMYIVPGLSFQEKTLEWYEKKYQIEIKRIPHVMVSEFFHYGSFRPPDLTFPIISFNDVYQYVRLEFDMWWIAAGERMLDGLARRAMIHKSSSIDEQRGRIYPVSAWKEKEIKDYIKYHGLYMGADSQKLGFSFGSLHGNEMYAVKNYFPDDYQKILHLYPFAEASAKRYEAYTQYDKSVRGRSR